MERDRIISSIETGIKFTFAATILGGVASEINASQTTPEDQINRDTSNNNNIIMSETQLAELHGDIRQVEVAVAPTNPTETPNDGGEQTFVLSMPTFELTQDMISELNGQTNLTRAEIESIYENNGIEMPINFDNDISFIQGDPRIGESAQVDVNIRILSLNEGTNYTWEYIVKNAIDQDQAPDNSRAIIYTNIDENNTQSFDTYIFKDNDGTENGEVLGVYPFPILNGGIAIVPARFKLNEELTEYNFDSAVFFSEEGEPIELTSEQLDELGVEIMDTNLTPEVERNQGTGSILGGRGDSIREARERQAEIDRINELSLIPNLPMGIIDLTDPEQRSALLRNPIVEGWWGHSEGQGVSEHNRAMNLTVPEDIQLQQVYVGENDGSPVNVNFITLYNPIDQVNVDVLLTTQYVGDRCGDSDIQTAVAYKERYNDGLRFAWFRSLNDTFGVIGNSDSVVITEIRSYMPRGCQPLMSAMANWEGSTGRQNDVIYASIVLHPQPTNN